MTAGDDTRAARRAAESAAWRNPDTVVGLWDQTQPLPPAQLAHRVSGDWWSLLAKAGITLLVTREYEHLAMGLSCEGSRPRITYARVPHPSGVAVDRRRRRVYLASTRNPNQVLEWAPAGGTAGVDAGSQPLLPSRSWFLPGRVYLHDLVVLGGALFGASAGMNAVVRLAPDGGCEPVWWPACVERRGKPSLERNYIQLNSIAAEGAGAKLPRRAFYTASTDRMGHRRPGQRHFAVDGRGVVFDGRTREVSCRGLTRPHSARLHGGRLWVLNSGYGTIGLADGPRYEAVAALPGWTRGLAFHDGIAYIGISRVLPRFEQYAPGLDLAKSRCGIVALCVRTGRVLGSLTWPDGNQIFGIEWIPRDWCSGFPGSRASPPGSARQTDLYFHYHDTGRT